MRWITFPGRRRRKEREQAARKEAQQALAEAREAKREIEERRPIVLAIVHRLRVAREENHFRERIEAAYAARRGAA